MNLRTAQRNNRTVAMTVTELMIAVAIGSMVLIVAGILSIFGQRSFVAMGNYSDLDAKSRSALDRMTEEMRQATQVLGYRTNLPTKWLLLTNANEQTSVKYTWDADDRTVICQKAGQPEEIFLTECDQWNFTLYQRTPLMNGTNAFFPATDVSGAVDLPRCKLVAVSWRCSREFFGQKMNTESMQTALVVLRNKL